MQINFDLLENREKLGRPVSLFTVLQHLALSIIFLISPRYPTPKRPWRKSELKLYILYIYITTPHTTALYTMHRKTLLFFFLFVLCIDSKYTYKL